MTTQGNHRSADLTDEAGTAPTRNRRDCRVTVADLCGSDR